MELEAEFAKFLAETGLDDEKSAPSSGSQPKPVEDPEQKELAEKIKMIQRSGPDAIRRWRTHCTRNSPSSCYDPMRHPKDFIAKFLRMEEMGHRPLQPPLIIGPDDPKRELAQRVTALRNSEDGSKSWWAYCDKKNTTTYDPTRQSAEILQSFLTQWDSGQRQRPDRGESKTSLIQRVKQASRGNPENKRTWYKYCDTHGASNYDPARHDQLFLRRYLEAIEARERDQAWGSSSSSGEAKEMAATFTAWAQANGCQMPRGFAGLVEHAASAVMGCPKGTGKANHTAALLNAAEIGKPNRGIVPSGTFSKSEFGLLDVPDQARLNPKRGANLIGSGIAGPVAVMTEEEAKAFQESLKKART